MCSPVGAKQGSHDVAEEEPRNGNQVAVRTDLEPPGDFHAVLLDDLDRIRFGLGVDVVDDDLVLRNNDEPSEQQDWERDVRRAMCLLHPEEGGGGSQKQRTGTDHHPKREVHCAVKAQSNYDRGESGRLVLCVVLGGIQHNDAHLMKLEFERLHRILQAREATKDRDWDQVETTSRHTDDCSEQYSKGARHNDLSFNVALAQLVHGL